MSAIKSSLVGLFGSEGMQKSLFTIGLIGATVGINNAITNIQTNRQVYKAISEGIDEGKCTMYLQETEGGILQQVPVTGGTIKHLTPYWGSKWEEDYLRQLNESRINNDDNIILEINTDLVSIYITPEIKSMSIHLRVEKTNLETNAP